MVSVVDVIYQNLSLRTVHFKIIGNFQLMDFIFIFLLGFIWKMLSFFLQALVFRSCFCIYYEL